MQWPFNPDFPKAFNFPVLGSERWLGLTLNNWPKVDASSPDYWRTLRHGITGQHHAAAQCFFNNPELKNYAHPEPALWVETLLDPEKFWAEDINAWALYCVDCENEQRPTSEAASPEHWCRRFHAYQQARYRWHEQLLERNCSRALGKAANDASGRRPKEGDKMPKSGAEARACLIGWLSLRPGFSKHPRVSEFTRRKPTKEHRGERTLFDKERATPSNRLWRRKNHNDVPWLVLTWPVWNFCGWSWAEVRQALRAKFPEFTSDGTRLLGLTKAEQVTHTAKWDERWEALKSARISSFEQTESERDLERNQRRADKAVEKLCRKQVGLPIEPRPTGRPESRTMTEKPPFRDFANGFIVSDSFSESDFPPIESGAKAEP